MDNLVPLSFLVTMGMVLNCLWFLKYPKIVFVVTVVAANVFLGTVIYSVWTMT